MEFFVYPIFWLVCAGFSAALANSKGRSGGQWFLLGLLFGPFGLLVGLMPVVTQPPSEPKPPADTPSETPSDGRMTLGEKVWAAIIIAVILGLLSLTL